MFTKIATSLASLIKKKCKHRLKEKKSHVIELGYVEQGKTVTVRLLFLSTGVEVGTER